MNGTLWAAVVVGLWLWPGHGHALELSGEPVQPIAQLNVDAGKVELGKKLFLMSAFLTTSRFHVPIVITWRRRAGQTD